MCEERQRHPDCPSEKHIRQSSDGGVKLGEQSSGQPAETEGLLFYAVTTSRVGQGWNA